MSTVDDTLRLYAETAERRDWPRDHIEAMQCRDLEDFLSLGNWLYARLSSRAQQIQDEISAGSLPYDPAITRDFAEAFQLWLRPSAIALSAIEVCEQRGYPVEGAETYRQCVRELSEECLDAESIIRGIEDAKQGRGRPLSEAMDELRRRHSA